jgi:hypothetical protein
MANQETFAVDRSSLQRARRQSHADSTKTHIHARSTHRLEKPLMRLSCGWITRPIHSTRAPDRGHTATVGAQASSAQCHELLSLSRQRDSEYPAHHHNPPAIASRPITWQIPVLPLFQISNTLPPCTKYNFSPHAARCRLGIAGIQTHISNHLSVTSAISSMRTGIHSKNRTPRNRFHHTGKGIVPHSKPNIFS